ncbi:unnamed protein product [Soboliphyme baturini]|uniref:Uncharacterized protein n=1 Tax=Soboliphyme baturini TaxID=241478 RepID=A0A183IG84_9BILA|nr:unnamed protein product [Soboliphyme baturini]
MADERNSGRTPVGREMTVGEYQPHPDSQSVSQSDGDGTPRRLLLLSELSELTRRGCGDVVAFGRRESKPR